MKKRNSRDELIVWLNDAYSMELAVEEALKRHIKHTKEQPEIQNRLQRHLGETRNHAQRMKDCIKSAGGKVSRTKAVFGDVIGKMNAVSTGMFEDKLVKDLLAEDAAEHFEIASYNALIAGAETLGENQIASVCREILQEEKQMAQWVEDQIPNVVQSHLREQAPA